jgi:hypothetical protein
MNQEGVPAEQTLLPLLPTLTNTLYTPEDLPAAAMIATRVCDISMRMD